MVQPDWISAVAEAVSAIGIVFIACEVFLAYKAYYEVVCCQ